MEFKFEKICGINRKELTTQFFRLEKAIGVVNEALKAEYKTNFGFLKLVEEKRFLQDSEELAKKFKNVELLVLVGIGGSNLGTLAAEQALNKNKLKVLYADNVDAENLKNIIKMMQDYLKQKKEVVLNCVTKSGITTETIANFEVLLEVLKTRKDYKKYVVVTTDKNSKLYEIARKEGYNLLEIPENVIGRYSMFSNVGLFPLKLAGADIRKLLRGARVMRDVCLSKNIIKNPAALSALIAFLHYRRGKSIIDLFLFSNELEGVGKFCRQLLSESVGKEKDFMGRLVNAGMTPIVSIGSTDLHSMAQLYLGGPKDKVTCFVYLKKLNAEIRVPKAREFLSLVRGVQGKRVHYILHAIYEGLKETYLKKDLPFVEILLKDNSEYSIGELLQMKMMETVYLAYLFNVDPFDQPEVDEYKEKTMKFLK